MHHGGFTTLASYHYQFLIRCIIVRIQVLIAQVRLDQDRVVLLHEATGGFGDLFGGVLARKSAAETPAQVTKVSRDGMQESLASWFQASCFP